MDDVHCDVALMALVEGGIDATQGVEELMVHDADPGGGGIKGARHEFWGGGIDGACRKSCENTVQERDKKLNMTYFMLLSR